MVLVIRGCVFVGGTDDSTVVDVGVGVLDGGRVVVVVEDGGVVEDSVVDDGGVVDDSVVDDSVVGDSLDSSGEDVVDSPGEDWVDESSVDDSLDDSLDDSAVDDPGEELADELDVDDSVLVMFSWLFDGSLQFPLPGRQIGWVMMVPQPALPMVHPHLSVRHAPSYGQQPVFW